MAENRGYLHAPIPSAEGGYRSAKYSFGGLNLKLDTDTGELTEAKNVSLGRLPMLTSMPKPSFVWGVLGEPISLHAFDGFLLVVYRDEGKVMLGCIKDGGRMFYKGVLDGTGKEMSPRSIVQFNVYSDPEDPVGGEYIKKLLIFPDKLSVDYDITADFLPASLDAGDNVLPNIKYACVYYSRLFGVDDDRIYASAFNDYANFNLDTADDTSEANAWVTTAQSNVKAGGSFTGICAYGGHVIAFKRDYTHEIYNNKNPFRVYDIFNEGCVDQRSIAEVDGGLYYVSPDGVRLYTGGNPRDVGESLDMTHFESGVGAGYKGCYYLAAKVNGEHRVLVYSTSSGAWSSVDVGAEVISLSSSSDGIYALTLSREIWKLDTEDYSARFEFATDIMTGGSVDIKRVKKLQAAVEVERGGIITVYLEGDDGVRRELVSSYGRYGKLVLRCGVTMTAGVGHRLIFAGKGRITLRGFELIYAEGGERYDRN